MSESYIKYIKSYDFRGGFRTNVASVGSAIKGTHKNILESFATLNDKNRIDNSHDRLNFDPGNMNKIFHFS